MSKDLDELDQLLHEDEAPANSAASMASSHANSVPTLVLPEHIRALSPSEVSGRAIIREESPWIKRHASWHLAGEQPECSEP
jgi:hypothetical protein